MSGDRGVNQPHCGNHFTKQGGAKVGLQFMRVENNTRINK